MSENLRELLWIIVIGPIVGVSAGIAIRKVRPNWCKSYTKFAMHKKWYLFLAGFLMFGCLAYNSFSEQDIPSAAYFGVFAAAHLLSFFWFGFKPLSPEMRKKIDDSDPTKFFGKS